VWDQFRSASLHADPDLPVCPRAVCPECKWEGTRLGAPVLRLRSVSPLSSLCSPLQAGRANQPARRSRAFTSPVGASWSPTAGSVQETAVRSSCGSTGNYRKVLGIGDNRWPLSRPTPVQQSQRKPAQARKQNRQGDPQSRTGPTPGRRRARNPRISSSLGCQGIASARGRAHDHLIQ
jgi:hypothetical protein